MTTLAELIAGDYAHMDGTETVTVTTQPGSVATEATALQSPLNLSAVVTEMFASETRRTVWNVWSTSLTIRPGDKITDASGTDWLVESSQQVTLKTRWRCVCSEAR